MRWAVIWGPIIGFILLYFVLRFAVNQFQADRGTLEEYGVATLQEVQVAESTVDDVAAADAVAANETSADAVETTTGGASSGAEDANAQAVVADQTASDAEAVGSEAPKSETGADEATATDAPAGEDAAVEADSTPADVSAAADKPATETTAEAPTVEVAAASSVDATEDPTSIITAAMWVVDRLNGERALGGWPMTAIIGTDDSIIGSAGCNYYNTSFVVDGESLSVAVPTSTRMACPSDAATTQETEFLETLTEANRFDQSGFQLVLSGPDDTSIEFTSVLAFDQSVWMVDEYRDGNGELTPVVPGSEITALRDKSLLSGFTGCSNYQSGFTIEGEIILFTAPELTPVGAGSPGCEPGSDLALQAASYEQGLLATRGSSTSTWRSCASTMRIMNS